MWLPIAILAYFMNAGVYTADKYFLSKKIHSSIAYAFYVGIWSIGNITLFLFTPFFLPEWHWLILDLFAGLLFLAALIAWYKALHQSEATKVVPIVGAFIPVYSFILSYIFLGEGLSQKELMALFILIIGGVLISIKQKKESRIKKVWHNIMIFFGSSKSELHPVGRLIINSLIAAFVFAAYYVLIKYIYLNQPFLGSFIWTRMGSFLGALLLLIPLSNRAVILEKKKRRSAIKSWPLFLSIRFLAVVAFILLNYAISLGNVALINALQGVQYVFLIFIFLVLSEAYPKILKEEMGKAVLIQKFMGVMLVGVGMYLLI